MVYAVAGDLECQDDTLRVPITRITEGEPHEGLYLGRAPLHRSFRVIPERNTIDRSGGKVATPPFDSLIEPGMSRGGSL